MPSTEETPAKEGFMRRIFLPIIVSCFLACGLAISAAPQTEPEKEGLPHPKTLEELQQAMRDVVEKNHLTGAGVALVSNGQLLWCGGIGKADLASNRDVTCDTEFRVGSISKTFVALALLKLQEDGRINLYSRLQDVAPEIPMKNRWEGTNPVRVVNLLEHSAGFDDMQPSEIYNRRDRADYLVLEHVKHGIIRTITAIVDLARLHIVKSSRMFQQIHDAYRVRASPAVFHRDFGSDILQARIQVDSSVFLQFQERQRHKCLADRTDAEFRVARNIAVR